MDNNVKFTKLGLIKNLKWIKLLTYPITKVKQVELQNLKPVAALRLKKQKPIPAPRKIVKKQAPKPNFMKDL